MESKDRGVHKSGHFIVYGCWRSFQLGGWFYAVSLHEKHQSVNPAQVFFRNPLLGTYAYLRFGNYLVRISVVKSLHFSLKKQIRDFSWVFFYHNYRQKYIYYIINLQLQNLENQIYAKPVTKICYLRISKNEPTFRATQNK